MTDAIAESWLSVGFLDLFDIQGGTQPPKSTFLYQPTEGYVQLLQIRDFGERPVPTYIPDSKSLKKCEDQDILIARYGASLGRILTGKNGAYNVAMAKVVIPEEVNRRYVYYLLQSEFFQSPLRQFSRSAQNGFNKNDLATFEIPLAPANEQKRIADKLDVLLTRVDACQKRLSSVPVQLRRIRQTVLAYAVSGKLTEDWRSEHAVEEWKPRRIEQLVTIKNGRAFPSADYSTDGIKLLRPGNLHVSGRVEWQKHNTTHLPLRYKDEFPDYVLQKGELLMNLTAQSLKDEFLGRVCLKADDEPALLNQRICAFYPKTEWDIRKYLLYYFKSPQFRAFVDTLDSGTLIKHMHSKQLLNHQMLLPSEDEQEEIVRRVEVILSFADKIEANLEAANNHVERLSPSLLAKAFRGELVPQDPNDEPAAELLGRIRNTSKRKQNEKLKPTKEDLTSQDTLLDRETKSEGEGMPKTSHKKKALVRKNLLDVLRAANRPMSPEELFYASGNTQDSVDEFFAELKALTGPEEEIVENRTAEGLVLLRARK